MPKGNRLHDKSKIFVKFCKVFRVEADFASDCTERFMQILVWQNYSSTMNQDRVSWQT
jgi:hypothetical protein